MAINPTFTPLKLVQGNPYQNPVDVASADGAITALAGGIILVTKAGVCAMTLAAPAGDGAVLEIVAQTANAHTLTISGGLAGAGSGADVGTFGGAIGDGVRLVGYGGVWRLLSKTNVTFA